MSQRITISPQSLYPGSISPLIYGEFIELLNDLIPGMWAEKVQDRSFEGVLQPAQVYPPGQNWVYPRWKTFVSGRRAFEHWPERYEELEMVNAEATYDLDRDNPFVGRQSAKVSVQALNGAHAGSFVAGIAQDALAVEQDQKLTLELCLRGDGTAETLKVMLGRNYGVFFTAYDEVEFNGLTPQWQKFTAQLSSPISDDNASLAIGLAGSGTFWADKVSLMPADNQLGWRSDVVQAVRALKPGIIRFGGSSLIFYDWSVGVGPRDQRAPFENKPWGNMEENDVGVHEFLEFCELVGAAPLICLNSNSATVEQILAEIEYCNGAADSPHGSQRAAAGHRAPFGVRYWQIGNEQSGEEYEQRMVDYARAIRARYPELTLLASYPSDNILFNLSHEVDYVCPHIYASYSPAVENEMRDLIDKIRHKARNPALQIAVTEWNHTGSHWGWARSWLLTLYNALNAARMFNLYHRLGDRIRIANRSNMTNSCNSGTIQTRGTRLYLTPTYYVQMAYANLAGELPLQVELPAGEPLDVSATRRGADGALVLFVVNYLGQPQQRSVDVSQMGRPGNAVEVWTLAGHSPADVNSFHDPHHIAPRQATLERMGDTFAYEFPAYSVTVLCI